jgi:steroid 5-alpha reductase family enzyme
LLNHREEFQFGAREDWRFTDMEAAVGGKHRWWWLSFFAAYLSQHVMLVGITWPLLVVHTDPTPWHPVWDTLVAVVAIAGEYQSCIQSSSHLLLNSSLYYS